MGVLTLSLPEGTASGVALSGNVKIVGIQAGIAGKKQIFYKGLAATAGNEIAVLGDESPGTQVMWPKDREIPCNGLYAALPNTHGCIIYYLDD